MDAPKNPPAPYGLLAEFDGPDELLAASRRTHEAGYRKIDAFSPFPVHGLDEAIGVKRTRLPYLVLTFGLLGALTGLTLQYWVSAIQYPLNIGGRPFFSWPSFIPITFECGIIGAAFSAAIGMILANKLPMPYHPLFNVAAFARASQDRFFLCVESTDPLFDPEKTRTFLQSLNPHEVFCVDP
ncbi:MAG: DUF3341 domain-containing protein [Candidatus Latescibacteria bacterium]|nr:DUF3341 domain-containing protein [Candidatus Latescibacterota bacterium]